MKKNRFKANQLLQKHEKDHLFEVSQSVLAESQKRVHFGVVLFGQDDPSIDVAKIPDHPWDWYKIVPAIVPFTLKTSLNI